MNSVSVEKRFVLKVVPSSTGSEYTFYFSEEEVNKIIKLLKNAKKEANDTKTT